MRLPEKLCTLKVKVTAEHLRKGVANDCSQCPVALVLSEQFPQYNWEVKKRTICAYDRLDKKREFTMGENTVSAIARFDHHFEVAPFTAIAYEQLVYQPTL